MLVRSRNRNRARGGGSSLSNALLTLASYGATDAWDFIADQYIRNGTVGPSGLTVTRASSGYAETSDGRLVEFGANVLRRTDRGALIEGARTNLCLQSQTFDNASWTKSDTTVTANAATAPDGTLTADKIVASATTAVHKIQRDVSVSSPNAYTFSVFAKAAEYGFCSVNTGGSGGAGLSARTAVVNLTTGALVSETVTGMTTITALASGWYRISVTTAAATGSGSPGFFVEPLSTSTAGSYTGDGTSGIFLWGAQLEAASFPSSYVPTTSASVTRAADAVDATISYGGSVSTFVEYSAPRASNVSAYDDFYFVVNSNNVTTYMYIYNIEGGVGTNTPVGNSYRSGTFAANTVHKAAAVWQTNRIRAVVNGTLATAVTTATEAPAGSFIRAGFGYAPGVGGATFVTIRRAAIISRALTDAELQGITT